jgi:cytoskeleton protein RodZ
MPSIGDTLREARMRQRLDIADVEARTKIRAKYLRALENEEFGLLPGSTFVRTFLRTYAEVLGLDPHVLVEEYRTNFEPRDDLEIPFGPPPGGGDGGAMGRERRYPGGVPGRGTVAAIVAVVFVVFLLILGVTGNDHGGKGKQAAQTTTGKKKHHKKRKHRKAAPTSVSLKLTPTTPTYVCVDNGPGSTIVYQGILQEARTFKGKKIRVNLGKSSVGLEENGKPVQFQQTGNPVGFEFSTKGHKQLDLGQRPCATPGA